MTVSFQMLGNAALMEQPKAFRNGRDARCPSAPPRWRLSMWPRRSAALPSALPRRRLSMQMGRNLLRPTARAAPVGEWRSRRSATLPHGARFQKMRCRIRAAYMVE